MATIYPAALSHFAVFCPSLGPDEHNTHEQLLFYAAAAVPAFYPYSANDYFARNVHLRRRSSGGPGETGQTKAGRSPSHRTSGPSHSGVRAEGAQVRERVVSLDSKLREIGLGAALIAFAATFGRSESKKFHTVHSEKRRTLIYEAEPGVLVQLSVVLPRRVRPYAKEKDAYSIEFLDTELSDQALQAWLRHEYEAFRVVFGPVARDLRRSGSRQRVKRQLEAFFGKTMWHWDQRWDPRQGNELDLLFALEPLPLLPVGSISLGGFDEFWRDLGLLHVGCRLDADDEEMRPLEPETGDGESGQPLVHSAVVLWRGTELVWSSWASHDSIGDAVSEHTQLQRALVAWSRAVYAPAFNVQPSAGLKAPSRPSSSLSIAKTPVPVAAKAVDRTLQGPERGGSGWSLPGTSWLWGWRDPEPPKPAPTTDPAYASESESSKSSASDDVAVGISQALSRAVNALVEPRPPTPPEVDPVFMSEEFALSPNDVAGTSSGAMLVRDADAASLRSLASVQTTRTTVHEPVGRSIVGRNRSNTIQHAHAERGVLAVPGWQQSAYMRRSHGRAPSVASNATVESTLLRADTRVSSRGWWPWSAKPSTDVQSDVDVGAAESIFGDSPHGSSGTDLASTFVFTGEYPFPGIAHVDTNHGSNAIDQDSNAESHGETASQLGRAMDDDLPSAYAHGVDVDPSRGIVLAPRAVPGMMYDTRLVRLLFHSSINQSGAADLPLHIRGGPADSHGGCRVFAYKFGDLLFLALGAAPATDANPRDVEDTKASDTRRRRRRRARPVKPAPTAESESIDKFTKSEARAIEASILRYAESLHAATQRDARDASKQRVHEAQMARTRRVPPYVSQSMSGGLPQTHTSWRNEHIPTNQSFMGFVGTACDAGDTEARDKSADVLTAGVRQALRVVRSETLQQSTVCVRMHDKGWVAGQHSSFERSFCVVDQPNATLADAQTFLSRISRRASLHSLASP
ncbi:hypothetical protein GGF49_000484 [Coemansia sp. RSA 1853]|nr:hypothetical protein LPJ76_000744 [Coemansia sp. RSA 638]KAJ2545448.1 hypothetical protein GGF49_000484 [Coemansia sp. RSA 1853]